MLSDPDDIEYNPIVTPDFIGRRVPECRGRIRSVHKVMRHADAGGVGRENGHADVSLAHAYASDCGIGLNRRPANADADDGYHEHGDDHVREVRAHVRGNAIWSGAARAR